MFNAHLTTIWPLMPQQKPGEYIGFVSSMVREIVKGPVMPAKRDFHYKQEEESPHIIVE